MGDRHIVEEQPPIPVRRAAAQRAHMLFEHADVLAAGDRLRPIRQRIVDNVLAHTRILRDLDQGRKMS